MADTETNNKKLKDWRREIDLSQEWHKDYWRRCEKITKRYRNEGHLNDGSSAKDPRFNVFWANVDTTKELIYSRQPLPDVSRRWRDRDPAARVASELLERGLSVMMDNGFDGVMRRVVVDFLLCARGQVWERYDYTEGEDGDVLGERTCTDYLHWKDFLHSPGAVWPKAGSTDAGAVWWVARRAPMTRKQLVDRFGDIGKDVPLSLKKREAGSGWKPGEQAPSGQDKAEVFEIWDRNEREVVWIATDFDEILDERPDPLKLSNFFPCPEPFYGTLTNDTLIPVPDFVQLQSQLAELDDLTGRIDAMTRGLRVAGVCDGSVKALQELLDEGSDNRLIPIDNWTWFRDKGAIEGSVSWLPMQTFLDVLVGLHEFRDKVKEVIYEISGLADIIRGSSDPTETAAAQKIKGRWAGNRIRSRQTAMQQFIREIVGIKGEIIAEHFDVSNLARDCGISLPTNLDKQRIAFMQQVGAPIPSQVQAVATSPTVEDVQALLHADRLRMFRIDIETDSTLPVDDAEEKTNRMELVGAIGDMLEKAGALVQASPAMGPALKEMIMFAVRGFKAGRAVEEALEQALDQAAQSIQQQSGQPSPEQQLAQGTIEVEKAKLQVETAKLQNEQAKSDREFQLDAMKSAAQQQLDQVKLAIESVESAARAQKATSEAALNQIKAETTAAMTESELRQSELAFQADMFKAQAEQIKAALDHRTALVHHDTEMVKQEGARVKMLADAHAAEMDARAARIKQAVDGHAAKLPDTLSKIDELRRTMALDKIENARKKGPRTVLRDNNGVIIGMRNHDGTEVRVLRGIDGKIESVG